MSKLYLVMGVDWLYNDEYYYTDGEGGIPCNAFKTKEDAETEVEKLTLEWLKQQDSVELTMYGEDMPYEKDIRNEMNDIFGKDCGGKVPNDATDNELRQFLTYLQGTGHWNDPTHQYYVEEIEVI